MEAIKPIKRDKKMQPLSRDHHHSLLLSWKIRQGMSKGIALERIKTYCDWFFEKYAEPHFCLEEKYLFPVLGEDHKLIKKALADHRRLRRLFTMNTDLERTLSLLEEELEAHIRFEERVLFNIIQEAATEEQLDKISTVHNDEIFEENTEDEFWKIRK
ncbi:hypothetical protein C900_03915 [Fulvivirga imtechensis AK7]|uniref:Hemerythrin-like domain-containing protein n=1 Tax=Fulvivirga imtechensis AK7 TaxID=1237149 RepID=L8JN19_9BACT|nr:hemerythrin domain-containing protein [Fulvivirga imtechensis]ELR70230.1 hypothetical protein C900_03915 [Fulvivirga imtechensis AK7]